MPLHVGCVSSARARTVGKKNVHFRFFSAAHQSPCVLTYILAVCASFWPTRIAYVIVVRRLMAGRSRDNVISRPTYCAHSLRFRLHAEYNTTTLCPISTSGKQEKRQHRPCSIICSTERVLHQKYVHYNIDEISDRWVIHRNRVYVIIHVVPLPNCSKVHLCYVRMGNN